MFQTGKSWAKAETKLGKYFGPAGTLLSAGMVWYEVENNKWDAHTIVDGILVIAAAGFMVFGGGALALTVIAGYGVLDYFLDISGGIDSLIGRDSELGGDRKIWD